MTKRENEEGKTPKKPAKQTNNIVCEKTRKGTKKPRPHSMGMQTK